MPEKAIRVPPALLSTRRPTLANDGRTVTIRVENYGLSESKPSCVKIMSKGVLVGKGNIPALSPYGIHDLVVTSLTPLDKNEDITFDVTLTTENKETTTHF